MTVRTVFALLAALLLASATVWSVTWMNRQVTGLTDPLDRAIEGLKQEDGPAAAQAFADFKDSFAQKRGGLSLFVSDIRIHEIEIASAKAGRMLEAREWAMAQENLQELREIIVEFYAAFAVTGENIL